MANFMTKLGTSQKNLEDSVKKLVFFFVILVALIGLVSTPAMAQTKGAAYPGMVVSSVNEPITIKLTGITGQVMSFDYKPVKGASVVVSLVRQDQNGEWFTDHSTAKKFEPCTSKKTIDCVGDDGMYTISATSLPPSDNPFNRWRLLDIRAEAVGYFNYLGNRVRVDYDESRLETVPPVMMQESELRTGSQVYAWREDDKVVSFGFWASQDWSEKVIVDFVFKGSAWTTVKAEYGMQSTLAEVGPGSEGSGVWIVRRFWIPQNYTSYYGGSICGTIQIRSIHEAEWIKAQFKEVCVTIPQPAGGEKG
jgi:hypothetical protein